MVKDYLPEPPIPTRRALLLSAFKILEILSRFSRQSVKRTRSNLEDLFSILYLSLSYVTLSFRAIVSSIAS